MSQLDRWIDACRTVVIVLGAAISAWLLGQAFVDYRQPPRSRIDASHTSIGGPFATIIESVTIAPIDLRPND